MAPFIEAVSRIPLAPASRFGGSSSAALATPEVDARCHGSMEVRCDDGYASWSVSLR